MKTRSLCTQRNRRPSEDADTSPVTMILLHPFQWTRQLASHRNRFAHWMFYVWSSKKNPSIKTEESSPIQSAMRWSNGVTVDTGCTSPTALSSTFYRGECGQTICFLFHLLKSRDHGYCINKFSSSYSDLFIQGCLPHRGKEKNKIFLTFGGGKTYKE